jgi:hypothetical protein
MHFDVNLEEKILEKPTFSISGSNEIYSNSRQESGFVNIKRPFDAIDVFPVG